MIILAMALLGVITFFYRYSFISESGKKMASRIPPVFLRLLAPATFATIIFNAILNAQKQPEIFNQRLAVGFLALIVAYFTKSVVATLIFGLGLLYALQHFTV